MLSHPLDPLDIVKFNESCGVGVHITTEQVKQTVADTLAKHKDELVVKRYKFPQGVIMAELRTSLKWADGKLVKSEVDAQIATLLGPKTEADLNPAKEAASKEKANPAVTAAAAAAGAAKPRADEPEKIQTFMELAGEALNFHKPGKRVDE